MEDYHLDAIQKGTMSLDDMVDIIEMENKIEKMHSVPAQPKSIGTWPTRSTRKVPIC